jgi:SAM-dependent methyltransferase
VCAGPYEKEVFEALGFTNYTLSSISGDGLLGIREEDAMNLSYHDQSFDNCIAHAGLHHCSQPHRAITEMYRVAKRNVIIIEAQDTFVSRVLNSLGLSEDYELQAVRLNRFERGGVDDTPIPNYVYRWKKREIQKLIMALDPAMAPDVHFFPEFYFDLRHLDGALKGHALARAFGPRALGLVMKTGEAVLNLALKRLGNSLTVVIRKAGRLNPWMRSGPNGPEMKR